MGRVVATAVVLAVFATGCAEDPPSLPAACSNGPAAVRQALRAAPGNVQLADGTLLSACVAGASDDAEIQQVGFALTPVADRLRGQRTEGAATQLGFLVGAVRRGAGRTNGIHVELVRRMENRVDYDDPALLEAAERGAVAGAAHG